MRLTVTDPERSAQRRGSAPAVGHGERLLVRRVCLVPSPSFIKDGKKHLRQCFDAKKCMKQWLRSSKCVKHCFHQQKRLKHAFSRLQ